MKIHVLINQISYHSTAEPTYSYIVFSRFSATVEQRNKSLCFLGVYYRRAPLYSEIISGYIKILRLNTTKLETI